jgi:integral membrane protein
MTEPLRRMGPLRLLCLGEGLSLLLLVGVAMPLKYLAGQPAAVRWVGLAHGLLWLALCLLLLLVARRHRWGPGRICAVLVSSLLPLGFLVIDPRLRAWDAEVPSGHDGDG